MRLVHSDGSFTKGGGIELYDGSLSIFSAAHVHKAKALASSRVSISNHCCRGNRSNVLKETDQIVFIRVVGKSPNIESHTSYSCVHMSRHARRNRFSQKQCNGGVNSSLYSITFHFYQHVLYQNFKMWGSQVC